jgi:hypothetical protein
MQKGTVVGDEYVSMALKGHYLEVHIPEFAEKYHITGSMSESGLELTHHDVNVARVCPNEWMEQQFHKNVLRTSDILSLFIFSFDFTLIIYLYIIRQYLPEKKQRGAYNCSRCYSVLHQNVPKKGHKCPYVTNTA